MPSGTRHPSEAPRAAGRPRTERPAHDTASDVVRWAAFSCALVPVVLLWYGTSLAGAAGTTLSLAAVTAVCRVLLRQSERGAGGASAADGAVRRGRHHRSGAGTRGAERHSGGCTPGG